MSKKQVTKIRLTPEQWEWVLSDGYKAYSSEATFSSALTKYMSDVQNLYGVRQKEISVLTGIESTVITKYRKGIRKPTITAVILLSLAMKLTPDRSQYLLYLSGFQLNECLEHRIYRMFLFGCAYNDDYNISNCNKVLKSKGLTLLKA